MKQYTAFFTIENIVHICFEAENDEEAERIAEEMTEDGSAEEALFGYGPLELSFTLDELTAE